MSWNMVGSFLYAFASMVLSIAVIQLVGEDLGGIFTFGYTIYYLLTAVRLLVWKKS